MNALENNHILILNNIIYKVHTDLNFLTMRKEFLEAVKSLMDFDSAEFHLSKGKRSLALSSRVGYNCDLDFSQKYEMLDYSGGILDTGRCMVYRESDIVSEEKRVETQYYKKVYAANGWHHALQLILAYNGQFLGVITFYRNVGKPDFQYKDIFLIEILKEHLAYRLHMEKEKQKHVSNKISIAAAAEQYDLTKRETAILALIMKGMSNEAICAESVITNNTLKKHILNIYRKLDINNRVQLFQMIKENV